MDIKALGENLGLDESEYIELIELFLDSGRSDHRGLIGAIADRNIERVKKYSHTIAGAAGNLGLNHIFAPAKEIEMQADHLAMDILHEKATLLGSLIDELESFV